jgi:DNA-binding GntR family transcriptional regulator
LGLQRDGTELVRAFADEVDSAFASPFGDRSLSREVYAQILDAVRRGDLKPGERINESDVARRLGISRTPIREAISRLCQDGLLTYVPRRGAFLARPTPADIEEIEVARSLIEGFTARLASQRITPADVMRLEALIDDMAAAARAGDWLGAIQTNARFHETVVGLSGNRLLTRMWSSLDPLRWLQGPVVQPGEIASDEDLVSRHRLLMEALASGNPGVAERAFKEHIGAVADLARDVMEAEST